MSPRTFLKPESWPAWFGAVFTVMAVVGGSYVNLQANDRLYAEQISEMRRQSLEVRVQTEKAIGALELESRRRNDRTEIVLDRITTDLLNDANRLAKLEALVTIPYRK